MKFEREAEIPEFRAKTETERRLLREQARSVDPTIRKLEFLGLVIFIFLTKVADWISKEIRPDSFFLWLVIYLFLAIPFGLAFHGFCIVPRIRQAFSHATKI
jgi:hypothetical protein